MTDSKNVTPIIDLGTRSEKIIKLPESETRSIHNSFMQRKSEHAKFHGSPDYKGLVITMDSENRFMCSTLGDVTHDEAFHMIDCVTEALALETIQTVKG